MVSQKETCNCGKIAVWVYMPGFSNGGNPHFCEDCVSRGCSCNHNYVNEEDYYPPLNNPNVPLEEDGLEGRNWKWIEKDKIWCHIDEQGREYPCCEYMYDEEGFEK